MEWGGLLRKMRSQDTNQGQQAPPDTPAGAGGKPNTAATVEQAASLAATGSNRTVGPLIPRRTWASGAFLAAAARLVARGEEATYTLRRVVEWATAATGATHAVLWAVDGPLDGDNPLTLLAWAATDGWKPTDETPPHPQQSAAIMRALRNPEAIIVDADTPAEREVAWITHLGVTPIALCAAISGGTPRGLLLVAGLGENNDPAGTFGEDARAALAACAALAAIVFERRETSTLEAPPSLAQEESAPEATATTEPPDAFQSLPDRAAMLARLEIEVGRARRFGHPLAVLNLDVDRFGEWSAQAGEVVAKIALAHLTTIISESIREVDLLGRGDDDDFILILPVSEADDALRVGERIRSTLARRQPNWPVVGLTHRLTLSGGAVGHPDDGATADELLNAAERTTAYAKRMGRDQIRMRGLGEMESPAARATVVPARSTTANLNSIGVRQIFQGLIDALSVAGDAHDQARPGHGRAVGRYARALAEACGLAPDQAQIIELAGILHDAGKIGLPAEILGKRGALTAEERAILREQPAVGKLMLLQVPSLEGVVPLVEHAHERFDGAGYPDGLRGNQIPFGARIIAIAEGYEAMTSDRPYRQALSHSMAIAELWRESGGRYDPRLIDVFVRLVGAPDKAPAKEDWNPQLLERVTITPEPTSLPHTPAPAPTLTLPPTNAAVPVSAPDHAADSAAPRPPLVRVAEDTTSTLPTPPLVPQSATDPGMADSKTTPIPQAGPAHDLTDADSPAPRARGLNRLLQRWPTDTTATLPQTAILHEADAKLTSPAPAPPTAPPATTLAATPPPATDQAIPVPHTAADDLPQHNQWPGEKSAPPTTTPAMASVNAPSTLSVHEPERQPEPNTADTMIVWYDDEPGLGNNTVAAIPVADDETDEGEEQSLSLDNTLLVQSQTSLMRMAELGRLSKRRTGYFYLDRTKE